MIKNYINNIEVSSPDSLIPSGLLKNLVVYKIYSQESISNEFEHRIFILIKGEIEKQSKTKVLDLGEKKLEITIDYGKNKSKRIITGIVADIINSGYIEYGGNVNYNYELVLVPPTIIYEDMEFKNKTYKEEKFEGLLDKIFNKSVISVNFKKNAEIFEEKFGDQINYNQINETNLHFFKKTMKLFGLNYYYKYSKGSYTCNVQENLAFGKEFKESSSIQLLENIILNKNLLQKKIRGYELDTSNDKWQEFVDKNINNLNAPKKVIKANCSDLSVDLSTIIKFPQKQFGQELKARIYKYNLVINKQIHSENIKGIENFDNVSMAFETIVEEQNVEYGYVGEMSILPIQTTNYSSSSSIATQDLALAKNSALNVEFRQDNIQLDYNKQKIYSTQTSIKDQLVIKKACVVENTDKSKNFNTFQAKVFEHVKGNFQLSKDTLTVNLTMPIGIDASFYRMPIENDIVLIVNIDGVWYLHSCLMEKIENNSKITTPKNMFIESKSTNEESNLKDMGDQCLWAYDYKIIEGEKENTYKRKGSSLSLGKVNDLQKYSLDYWKKRNLQDRKLKQYQTINSLFKELEKTDNFESSLKDENSKDEYIVNIDTEGLVNIDADENIFAQSGKDMYLTGENIYMSSIEGNVELRAEKSIVLKVGRSSLIITEEGISLNVIDTVSPSRNAVVSLSNMEGVMISGTEFSAKGHFGAKLGALGGSVGIEGCIASIAAHKVYLSAPSAVSLIANGAANALNMVFDNIEGCSEEGNSFSDADQLEQIRMIALKIKHMKHLFHEGTSRSKAAGVFETLVLVNHIMYIVEKLAFFMIKAESETHETHEANEKHEAYEKKLRRLELAIYSAMHINYITETATLILESFSEAPLGTWVPSALSLYPHKIETESYKSELKVSQADELHFLKLPNASFFDKHRYYEKIFNVMDHIFYFTQRDAKNKTTK